MDTIKREIDIDLYSPTSYEIIKAQQGDNLSRIIEFFLYDQGNRYKIPDNTIVRLEGHRGDNSSFIKEDSCFVSENSITVTLDSDILYAHGIVEAKIVMEDSNYHILSTIPFRIHVQRDPCNKAEIEKKNPSLIDWLVSNFNKLKKLLESHLSDKIAHLSKSEHDRFNKLQNEVFLEYNENLPNDSKTGDYFLKEYK